MNHLARCQHTLNYRRDNVEQFTEEMQLIEDLKFLLL